MRLHFPDILALRSGLAAWPRRRRGRGRGRADRVCQCLRTRPGNPLGYLAANRIRASPRLLGDAGHSVERFPGGLSCLHGCSGIFQPFPGQDCRPPRFRGAMWRWQVDSLGLRGIAQPLRRLRVAGGNRPEAAAVLRFASQAREKIDDGRGPSGVDSYSRPIFGGRRAAAVSSTTQSAIFPRGYALKP